MPDANEEKLDAAEVAKVKAKIEALTPAEREEIAVAMLEVATVLEDVKSRLQLLAKLTREGDAGVIAEELIRVEALMESFEDAVSDRLEHAARLMQ